MTKQININKAPELDNVHGAKVMASKLEYDAISGEEIVKPYQIDAEILKGERIPGEKGDKGDKGDPGADGKSAYEIAVNNGFNGTEQEWLESLKAKSEKNTWVFRGDLSVTGSSRIWEFENIRINIARKDDSTIGIIFYSDTEIELQIVSSHISDFSINTKKEDQFVVSAAGKIVDDINVTEDWLQARIIQGDTVYKVEGFGFGNPTSQPPVYFSKCFMLVEKVTASEVLEETGEPYLRRWVDDLSTSGSTMEIPVDDFIFKVAYKGIDTLSMTVRSIVAGAKIAFNRSSIYHGTPEATYQDWGELSGEINVDDTIYNDSRDRCSVRFMTEHGSYKLDLSAFDKGRKVEALLYNYSEISVEE